MSVQSVAPPRRVMFKIRLKFLGIPLFRAQVHKAKQSNRGAEVIESKSETLMEPY